MLQVNLKLKTILLPQLPEYGLKACITMPSSGDSHWSPTTSLSNPQGPLQKARTNCSSEEEQGVSESSPSRGWGQKRSVSAILEVQASQREGSSPISIATLGHGMSLTVESQSDRELQERPVVRDKST